MNAIRTMSFLALASLSGAAAAQDIDCQSRNYQYQFCSTRDEVVRAALLQQESQAACVQGRTWGWNSNGVWVTNGCGGRFRVETSRPAPPPPAWSGERMSCESRDYRYEFCNVPARVYRVEVVRQKSSAACVLGRTWGWREDGVWVSEGCQADFRVQTDYRPAPPQGPGLLSCESHSYRYNFCGTGPISSAQLVEQRSQAPCVRNQSWGTTKDGIWVDAGCSATFRIRGRR